MQQLTIDRESWKQRQIQAEEDLVRWTELQEHAAMRLAQNQEMLERAQEGLPAFEDAEREAQAQASQFRGELSGLEQRLQVAQANRSNAERNLARITQQIERLQRDEAALAPPDADQLQALAEQRESAAMALAELQEQQAVAEESLMVAEQHLQDSTDKQRTLHQEFTQTQARHQALKQLQERVQASGSLPDWLRKVGLQERPALWQKIRVTSGWELAVEAVLRDRLKAVACGQQDLPELDRCFAEPPALRLTLVLPEAAGATITESADALMAQVECLDGQMKPVLARWLATQPSLLILDEPTRGIDIAAKQEIMNEILALAKQGMAVLFISSEMEEVVRVSDRIVVLRDRAKVGELPAGTADHAVYAMIAGQV